MPYDESLANRIRTFILPRTGTSEKKMFGGLGLFVHGNMSCGVWKDLLVIRLSKEEIETALKEDHTRVMDITGRPMKGWIFVEPKGFASDKDLIGWIEKAYTFAESLPKK